MIPDSSLRGAWPRLVAEFFVIVIGVLVALGVDSWVSWARDRELEVEYLERLLEDVEYDLAEISFVEAVATAGRAYTDSLLAPDIVDEWDSAHLLGALIVASNARQVDLSRSTLEELVNSGRIGLIRSRTLRTELANYDRLFLEMVGFWDRAGADLQIWVRSQMSDDVVRGFRDACSKPDTPYVSDPIDVCLFELTDWSDDRVRSELRTDQIRGLLNFHTWRLEGTLEIAEVFRDAAEGLRTTIEAELDLMGGAL